MKSLDEYVALLISILRITCVLGKGYTVLIMITIFIIIIMSLLNNLISTQPKHKRVL